jgi:hypothetical protein
MTETVPDTRSAVEKMQARAEAFAQGDGQALADRDKKTQTGSELFQSDLDDTLQWGKNVHFAGYILLSSSRARVILYTRSQINSRISDSSANFNSLSK